MAERRAKSLRALSGTGLTRNVARLDAVLQILSRADDLDEILAMGRNQLQRAMAENVTDLLCTISAKAAEDGRPIEVPAMSFARLMQRACRESPAYRSLLKRIWMESPTSADKPLHLVFTATRSYPVTSCDWTTRAKYLFASYP